MLLNYLKTNCKLIHYFGLGFIQIKINEKERYHFYTNKLPAIISDEEIHNHRYDFFSTMLKGSLTQSLFNIIIPGKFYEIEDESCQEGCILSTSKKLCDIELKTVHTYAVNSSYWIKNDVFHTVKTVEDTITKIERSEYKKEFAQVVRPINADKVCPFSQKVSEDVLWGIVTNMAVDL